MGRFEKLLNYFGFELTHLEHTEGNELYRIALPWSRHNYRHFFRLDWGLKGWRITCRLSLVKEYEILRAQLNDTQKKELDQYERGLVLSKRYNSDDERLRELVRRAKELVYGTC